MNKVSRRTVLGTVGTVLPAAFLGLALPRRTKAAAAAPDQPHMQAALEALRTAQHQLDVADPDKGGHRDKAIDYVRKAIEEVEKGIEYARRH